MNSRFLTQLDNQVMAASDRFVRRCLLAERAAYQARLGEIALARDDLRIAQSENNLEPNARASILINLADGVINYYQDMSPVASDRYQRARALAIASGQTDLQARIDSLIALLEYGLHHFDRMFKHLEEAAKKVSIDDNQTLCRICMIAGQTLHLANSYDLALAWYQKAKYFANEAHDDASMSALLHNMASIWAVNWRNSELGKIATRDSAQVARVGANSTTNFDQIIGSSALAVLTPLMKAQILSLECKYEEALKIYSLTLPSLSLKALGGWRSWLLADMAWCNLQLGNIDDARIGFESSLKGLKDEHHLDDRAATFSRLSEGLDILGQKELASSHRLRAIETWEAFTQFQAKMRNMAGKFLENQSHLLGMGN
jgi:tetratricopeptide (TPR) repeat protein